MPDIITDPVTVVKTVKTRAPFISISNPEGTDADPFAGKSIDFNCSHVLKLDGETVAAVNGPDLPSNVVRQLGAVGAETVTFTDPVTSQVVTLSVAGLALSIETLFAKWYAEDVA